MIQTFRGKETRDLYDTHSSKRWANIAVAALRKLDYLEEADTLDDLRTPHGNRLEALGGDRKGQHSIRINRQWRICFVWKKDGAHDVEIVDYH